MPGKDQAPVIDEFGRTGETVPVTNSATLPVEKPAASESMVGKHIGQYIIRRKLGQGGMGTVYEAVHESIGQHTAIKVLHPQLSQDSKFSERFLNEARATSIVRHPGLVNIYDHLKLPDGSVCLIMEFLEGESLESCLQRLRKSDERMPRARALEIIRQTSSALTAVHQAGIVHCDLKPDNIFLVPDPALPGGERIKLLDFGIAKFLTASIGQTTTMDLIMGSPRYIAPEQCEGREQVDLKADVYSLGVIYYELLAGERPFEAQTPVALMRQHINMKPPPLSQKVPDLDQATYSLVHAMLAKPKDKRPTMLEVLSRLGNTGAAGRRRPSLRILVAALIPLLPVAGVWFVSRQAPPATPKSQSVPAKVPGPAATPVPAAGSVPKPAPAPSVVTPPAPASPPAAAHPVAAGTELLPKPAVNASPTQNPGKRHAHRPPTKREEAAQPASTGGVLKSVNFGKE